jgi:hypothetical protein
MGFTLNNKVICQLLINRSEIEKFRDDTCFEKKNILKQKSSKHNKRKRTSGTKEKFDSVQLFSTSMVLSIDCIL